MFPTTSIRLIRIRTWSTVYLLLPRQPSALQVLADPLLSDLGGRISELASANSLPTFTNSLTAVEAGGLICYGASVRKVLRHMGYYLKKLLDAADPGDLPVEQPTELDLIVNLKTAFSLGIPTAVSGWPC
ncbi:hypothetical protein JQ621_31530 [Bradyrhizobium manausense]|uniref:ABC transporter substrate binding protein n=1 Tax=Bradyrhizobium manausense TaxID=989370 RepID=UPI001BA6D4ED|nr:ABC transporter substrate binding protein [Bradyrhizobium manausense]MBR1092013.1 hypothetical protein [Bradyrhizobium manausense]